MHFEPSDVQAAGQRAIKELEPLGYEAQRDVLLVLAAYTEAMRVLREAGIVPVDEPTPDNLDADERAIG